MSCRSGTAKRSPARGPIQERSPNRKSIERPVDRDWSAPLRRLPQVYRSQAVHHRSVSTGRFHTRKVQALGFVRGPVWNRCSARSRPPAPASLPEDSETGGLLQDNSLRSDRLPCRSNIPFVLYSGDDRAVACAACIGTGHVTESDPERTVPATPKEGHRAYTRHDHPRKNGSYSLPATPNSGMPRRTCSRRGRGRKSRLRPSCPQTQSSGCLPRCPPR